jgi:hypothetical protein
MEPENSLPLLQKPATLHYTKHSWEVAAKTGGIFGFHDSENETWYYLSWYGITLGYKSFWSPRSCNVQWPWIARISENIETPEKITICQSTEPVFF